MKHIYNIGKATTLALAALLSAACTNELAEQDPVTGLRPGDVALQWVPANMAVHTVTTRGTDPKTALEQQINNIHVFIFDNAGKYLGAQGNDAFQGYRYQEGNATMVLNRELFDNATQDASDATVVVLANIPKDTFHDTDGNGRPDEIKNIDSFADFVFNLPTFCATMPEGGLPMMVRKDDVDLSPNPEGTSGVRVETLQLRSLIVGRHHHATAGRYKRDEDREQRKHQTDNRGSDRRCGRFCEPPHTRTRTAEPHPLYVRARTGGQSA